MSVPLVCIDGVMYAVLAYEDGMYVLWLAFV